VERRKSIIWGVVLIIVGILALLGSMGFQWVNMEQLWPGLVILIGLGSLVNGIIHDPRDTDAVWFGLTAVGCGAVFAYVTLGGDWADMRWLWPAFPAVAGLAWLVAWLLDMRQVPNLVLAILAGGAGVVGWMITRGGMEAASLRAVMNYWPAILIVIGLALIAQYALQRR
jgi:hypothetical protein